MLTRDRTEISVAGFQADDGEERALSDLREEENGDEGAARLSWEKESLLRLQ